MAGWPATNNQKMSSRAVKENDMWLGPLLSPNSGTDLLQNCDLPPPLKVFSWSDRTVISSMKVGASQGIKAVQTRAREAERKAASLVKEKDCVANAFLRESFHLFVHRQWVRLLEFQVLQAQTQRVQQEKKFCCKCGRSEEANDHSEEEEEGPCDGSRESWIGVALTFCMGIVGLGLAFGWCYFL
ncbi:GTP cyclohydrolase II [Salix suchowensis]|nr:GTP cyclohydrolase II [Salix suchowensis]